MASRSQLTQRLKKYQDAEKDILEHGQEFTVGDTPTKYGSLSSIQHQIRMLEKRINRMDGRRSTISGINLATPGNQ